MGKRALIWTIILLLLFIYLFFNNYNRLSEYGADLGKMWPLLSIAVGFLILFRRKGRPKADFFFNNPKFNAEMKALEKQIAEQNTTLQQKTDAANKDGK